MRQDLLEKYRDINVDHDWYAWTEEDFASEMRDNYGIVVKNIQFSGFWSQGDGASFEVSYTNLWPLLGRLGLQDKYPEWGYGEHAFKVERYNSRYSHSNLMTTSLDEEAVMGEEEVVLAAVLRVYETLREGSYERLEKELTDFFRDQADDLYRRLEEEYEYLTSDEAVWDTIEANGLNEEEEDETV